jgi:hypothetical protein
MKNRAGISPRDSAGSHAPHARATNESSEPMRLLNGLNEQHGPNEFNEFNEFKEAFRADRAGKSPRRGEIPAPIEAADSELADDAEVRRFADRSFAKTTAALAFVARQKPASAEAKQRFVADLRQLVADPDTGDWLYGFAADLMLVYGSSRHPYADQIFGAIHDLIEELRNLRQVEKRKGVKPSPRGMRLNKVVHLTAQKFGIPTPTQRRQAKAAASTAGES